MLIPELKEISNGNQRHIARAISWVENHNDDYWELLKSTSGSTPVIGVTGPPGAGKSTLVNSLVQSLSNTGKQVAILAVDPSSPFNLGSLLGDRLRMQNLFMLPNVYIRSLSSRGSLGGLTTSIIEVVEILKQAPFDYIIIETVGVGQSEIEIAGIADTTIVVSVPESGDDIQTLKSGIMEIADIFVVNKADRDGAATFASHLKKLAHERADNSWETPVVLTQAIHNVGLEELIQRIDSHSVLSSQNAIKKNTLLAEKAYKLIQSQRMKDISIREIEERLAQNQNEANFNLFSFVEHYFI